MDEGELVRGALGDRVVFCLSKDSFVCTGFLGAMPSSREGKLVLTDSLAVKLGAVLVADDIFLPASELEADPIAVAAAAVL